MPTIHNKTFNWRVLKFYQLCVKLTVCHWVCSWYFDEFISFFTSEEYHASEIQEFKCTLCPSKFSDKQEFHSHVRDHFRPITCIECNKTFIGDKQYNYHWNHVHTSAKATKETAENEVYLADVTDIEIQDEIIEDGSVDSIETVPTNVACDVCGRLFPDVRAVIRHAKTHTNEGKKFFCNVCNKGFNKKTNLEFHLRIHTKER